ncbi:hypothetical protein [Mesorhizobium sp. M0047]|uniref:hypothetical protein n=1 Tax=Mesorhizobium sp. M0047 TaxID=2956859 RepID=UPI00333741E9
MRRLIVTIIALAVMMVSFATHPNALHGVDNSRLEISHVHDGDDTYSDEVSHQGTHHDHHAEMIFDGGVDFVGSSMKYGRVFDRTTASDVSIALDRPPDSARC